MRALAALLVLLPLWSGLAHADRALALDDALRLARERNRDLAAARERLVQSRAGIEQAWTALLPTVTAQGRYTHNYREVTLDLAAQNAGIKTVTDASVQLSNANPTALDGATRSALLFQQAVLVGLASQPAIVIQKQEQLDFVLAATVPLLVPSGYPGLQAARRGYESAQANYAVTEAQLLYQAAQAFFAAAGADELVTARQHAIEVAQKTLSDAQARLSAGVVNRVEVTRAELALVRARQAALETADTRAQVYRSLATLLILREPFRVVPADPPPPPAEAPERLIDLALKIRPEILSLDRTIAMADAQAQSAAWRWAPTLSAFGNVRAFNYAGFSGDQYSWALGLQADWLIYDAGARDSQRHLALSQRRESVVRLEQLRDTITDDLYNARRAVDTKRSALASSDRQVQLARETLDLVRVQRDAGTATQLDLLQAQDSLVAAEVAVAQARFDLSLADLALRRTIGTFPGR